MKVANIAKKIEEQWERFTEEVDYVVPLTMRRVIPTQTDCNWVESYEVKSAQAEDEEAQILIDLLNNKKPELGEVRLLSPAMRSYFLCLCQFRVIKGVL